MLSCMSKDMSESRQLVGPANEKPAFELKAPPALQPLSRHWSRAEFLASPAAYMQHSHDGLQTASSEQFRSDSPA